VTDPTIGFIGFGEAGSAIAKGLRGEGVTRLFAYDVGVEHTEAGETIRKHAREAGARLVESLEELAGASDVILSTVVANVALQVAEDIAAYLKPHHIYADMNSTSPAIKQKVGEAVERTGAGYVEATIMAAVPKHGHRVSMLLGGKAAPQLKALLTPYDMRLEILGESVGSAAAVKMFRSLLIKGIEALMLECLLGANRYGVEKRVLDSLGESFPGLDWGKMADYLISRTAIHGERRGREMEEVARTLEATGVEPVVAEAAAKRLLWCASLGLKNRFSNQRPPETYEEVMRALRAEFEK
jgi:3-hydroxyisobutyrate dehydrogenase